MVIRRNETPNYSIDRNITPLLILIELSSDVHYKKNTVYVLYNVSTINGHGYGGSFSSHVKTVPPPSLTNKQHRCSGVSYIGRACQFMYLVERMQTRCSYKPDL